MAKINLVALFSGVLFSIGLSISGMTKPQKVIGFLDVFGTWDMSLAFVMVGGIISYLFLHLAIRRRFQTPLLVKEFYISSQKELDKSLIFGALLFGIGWGLGGYCPGPAITSLGTGSLSAILFVLSMGLGMLIADRVISPFFFLSGKKPNTVN